MVINFKAVEDGICCDEFLAKVFQYHEYRMRIHESDIHAG